jgi:hypothetical protein
MLGPSRGDTSRQRRVGARRVSEIRVDFLGDSDMKVSPIRVAALTVLVVLPATSGCASPPTAEKTAAEAGIIAARSAGADRYAVTDFSAAVDAMKLAEAQMTAKEYTAAKLSYGRARELANKAARAAPDGKTAMKAEVEQQLSNTERRWQEIDAKIKAAMTKLKADQQQAAATDTQSVTEELQAAKTSLGDDPLAAKEKLATVTALLDKWEAEVKALPVATSVRGKPQKKY